MMELRVEYNSGGVHEVDVRISAPSDDASAWDIAKKMLNMMEEEHQVWVVSLTEEQ